MFNSQNSPDIRRAEGSVKQDKGREMILNLFITVKAEQISIFGKPFQMLRMEVFPSDPNQLGAITEHSWKQGGFESNKAVVRMFCEFMLDRWDAFIGPKQCQQLIERALEKGVASMGLTYKVRLMDGWEGQEK